MNHYIELIRPVFELMYFVAGIIVAFAAYKALEQIKVMKHESELRTKRESLIIAAEIIREFREKSVQRYEDYSKLLSVTSAVPYKMSCLKFSEINQQEIDLQKAYIEKLGSDIINSGRETAKNIERISLNLCNGIADSTYSFELIGIEYCIMINSLAPFIDAKEYPSCRRVFDSWYPMIVGAKLKHELEEKTKQLQSIQMTKIETLR